MRISDWSSDVCSSDLAEESADEAHEAAVEGAEEAEAVADTVAAEAAFDDTAEVVAGKAADREPLTTAGAVEGEDAVERKSVGEGKSVSVRVDFGGRRIIKKKNYN